MLDLSRVTALGTFRCSAIICLIPHVGLRFGGLLLSFWKLGLNIRCLVSLAQRRLILGPDLLRAQHTHHTLPYHTIQCQTIPYHTMPYLCQTIPYHTLSHNAPYLTGPYKPNLIILHLDVPHHSIQYHNPSDPPHFLPNFWKTLYKEYDTAAAVWPIVDSVRMGLWEACNHQLWWFFWEYLNGREGGSFLIHKKCHF